MSDAARISAFNSIFTTLGVDPHSDKVTEQVRVLVHTSALQYARALGYRLTDAKADGTAPRRQASGERSAVAGDGFTFRFGNCSEWARDASVHFWDCLDDREVLRFESLEEAVEDYIDNGCIIDERDDFETSIRQTFPKGLTVYGFRRREVGRVWLEQQAARMAEDFAEQLEDEFDDHLTGDHQTFEDDEQLALGADILKLLEKLKLEPWQCEQVAKVHLSLDELLEMLRELNPEWFEKTP